MRLSILALFITSPIFGQNQNFEAKKVPPPDAETLARIQAKTEELRQAMDALPKNTDPTLMAHVRVFHKAAVWIVRHGEWYTADAGKKTLEVLAAGLARAKALADGKTPWLDVRDRPIALGYRSEIDDSIQPYSIRYPENFDPKKKYRLDVVLHGRAPTMTEVSFLAGKEFAKPGKGTDYFVLEVYGRGNNAYRWAGETDVHEALSAAKTLVKAVDERQIVLRGFSMGGAGTWHLGLHHPGRFAVMSPGAGFSDTKTYIRNFPKQPEYIDKCLHIYDAVDYAENVFNIPIVAYSGGKDAQKAAANNIENILKNFREPHSFTHIVAPDQEHKMPPEWWARVDEQIRRELAKPRKEYPERVRFVTYSLKYPACDWISINALETHYERALIDASYSGEAYQIRTENVRSFTVLAEGAKLNKDVSFIIDGQKIVHKLTSSITGLGMNKAYSPAYFEKTGKNWSAARAGALSQFEGPISKSEFRSGPIDDAFTSRFYVVSPTGKPISEETSQFLGNRQKEFARLWDKYFRAELKPLVDLTTNDTWVKNRILFGDPQSNPEIARILPKMPIQWTAEKLVVNGKTYDPKNHIPVLIYPYADPGFPRTYVVINSGHTFREDALKGTNALLYPRLGDWAVLKPRPTKEDPAGFEVIDAGIFDENWQFKK